MQTRQDEEKQKRSESIDAAGMVEHSDLSSSDTGDRDGGATDDSADSDDDQFKSCSSVDNRNMTDISTVPRSALEADRYGV